MAPGALRALAPHSELLDEDFGFMGFRNPGVSIYHPLRSSLDGNSLQRTHVR